MLALILFLGPIFLWLFGEISGTAVLKVWVASVIIVLPVLSLVSGFLHQIVHGTAP